MKDLLSITSKRGVMIVEKLAYCQNEKGLELSCLLKYLKCSKKALDSCCDYLNETFDYLKVTRVRDTYSLKFKDGYSIKDVYSYYLKTETIFKLISLIFEKEGLTIKDMEGYLYTSYSTIYRKINSFNLLSKKKFNIEITTPELGFRGDEKDIRAFLLKFINERYLSYEWPFKDMGLEEEFIEGFLDLILEESGIPIPYQDYDFLKRFISLNIIRIKRGHVVDILLSDIKENLLNIYYKKVSDSKFIEKIDYYEKNLGIELGINNIVQIFSAFFIKEYVYSYEELEKLWKVDPIYQSADEFFIKGIQEIALDKGIFCRNPEEVLLKVHNEAAIEKYGANINYILNNEQERILRETYDLSDNCQEEIALLIKEYLKKLGKTPDESVMVNIEMVLINSWKDLIYQLMSKKRAKKILVISSFGVDHAKSMVQKIEFYLKNGLDIEIYQEDKIDYDKIRNRNYDIIISNFDLPRDLPVERVMITDSAPLNIIIKEISCIIINDTNAQRK